MGMTGDVNLFWFLFQKNTRAAAAANQAELMCEICYLTMPPSVSSS